MVTVAGKYELVSQENLDEFLKAQGLNVIKRKLVAKISPTLEIEFDGRTFTQKTFTTIKNSTMTCKIGEEYDHTVEELGITQKLITTKEGDEIITRLVGGDKLGVRKFTSDGMHNTMFKGDVVATRTFKRVQ